MKIRKSKINDIEQIVNLWKETGLYFEPFDKKERLIEKIKNEPELLLVAEDKEKIIGAVIGNYGWRVSIDHIAVDKEYRKHGIGKTLLGEIKRNLKAKGATIALIDSNLPKKFWDKLGCNYRGKYYNYTIKL
ncbi:MAG: GNAT family N-acetyltransferase [Candidatus Woesearchaeota archaeon]|nr:GNAT family N-acetyltransferase [Candidatus Woesearchaeota archaeon]